MSIILIVVSFCAAYPFIRFAINKIWNMSPIIPMSMSNKQRNSILVQHRIFESELNDRLKKDADDRLIRNYMGLD